jgi:catechol 2,3-dioxygenase-like lactoylglutathione lyase family enzyme
MRLVQARMVTDEVHRLAAFYADLTESRVALNDYYVEIPAGSASVGFSKRCFTEYDIGCQCPAVARPPAWESILDVLVTDLDAEYARLSALGVEWVTSPTTQPWGNRCAILRDPDGHLVNLFTRPAEDPGLRQRCADA